MSNQLNLLNDLQGRYYKIDAYVSSPNHGYLSLQLGGFGSFYPDCHDPSQSYITRVDGINTQIVLLNGLSFLALVELGLTIFGMDGVIPGGEPFFTHDLS